MNLDKFRIQTNEYGRNELSVSRIKSVSDNLLSLPYRLYPAIYL
jgi:hypothetical protein